MHSPEDELHPVITSYSIHYTKLYESDGGFGGLAVLMYGRTYTTDYFSRPGVDAVTQFWERNIIDDELRGLLEANRSIV